MIGQFLTVYQWLCTLCIVFTFSCSRYFHPSRIEHASVQVEHYNSLQEDSSLKQLIQPYRDSLTHSVKKVIAYASHDLVKQRPESTLGNWVADAMLEFAEELTSEDLDLAVTNYGGLRIQSIPAGPVTLEKMYELMPFDNLLVITDLKGNELIELLNHIAKSGGWPVSRGLHMTITEDFASNIMLNDETIKEERVYKVVINDYIANGGSDSHFLKGKPQRTLHVLMRDALIAVASKSSENQIQAGLENRIIHAKADE